MQGFLVASSHLALLQLKRGFAKVTKGPVEQLSYGVCLT